MNTNPMQTRTQQKTHRAIVHRTRGHGRGPITRLMSPSDRSARVVKPFVFLDLARFDENDAPMEPQFGWHPHSGIATVTVVLEGSIEYAETTGRSGVVPTGGIEFMRAGNGVWHTGAAGAGATSVFQLWIALPPELENGPNASRYVMPAEVPVRGPARVILGEHEGARSPIDAPPMTYLAVRLNAGERWTFTPPKDHDVAWIALQKGSLRAPERVDAGEMAIFARGHGAIDFIADEDAVFVLGSASLSPHDLVLGDHSVHTRVEALREASVEIRRIGETLRASGLRSHALDRLRDG
jgi:redox-sensitive bicupin YhaK (pirin superfamily)